MIRMYLHVMSVATGLTSVVYLGQVDEETSRIITRGINALPVDNRYARTIVCEVEEQLSCEYKVETQRFAETVMRGTQHEAEARLHGLALRPRETDAELGQRIREFKEEAHDNAGRTREGVQARHEADVSDGHHNNGPAGPRAGTDEGAQPRGADSRRREDERLTPACQRVYISGPMTGVPDGNVPAFEAAERALLAAGQMPISPHRTPVQRDNVGYLRAAIHVMMYCDAITLLPGWEGSIGARCEVAIALSLSLRFVDLSGVMLATPPLVSITGGYI